MPRLPADHAIRRHPPSKYPITILAKSTHLSMARLLIKWKSEFAEHLSLSAERSSSPLFRIDETRREFPLGGLT
jgi:hypothetical protein